MKRCLQFFWLLIIRIDAKRLAETNAIQPDTTKEIKNNNDKDTGFMINFPRSLSLSGNLIGGIDEGQVGTVDDIQEQRPGNEEEQVEDERGNFITTPATHSCHSAVEVEMERPGVPVITIGSIDINNLGTVDPCDTPNAYPAAWYKVVGTGNPIHASTCGSQTGFRSFISILTGETCNQDDLQCYNDNAESGCLTNPLASEVLFETQPGVTYYIYVRALEQNEIRFGNFRLTVQEIVTARPVPFHVNALEYQQAQEMDNGIFGNCVAGPPDNGNLLAPDAQTTTNDAICKALGPCHVGFTKSGESIRYFFSHTDQDVISLGQDNYVFVDITIRVASLRSDRQLLLEIFDEADQTTQFTVVHAPGKGYQTFDDVTWKYVMLDPEEHFHQLSITFLDSNVNLCSVKIDFSDIDVDDQDDGGIDTNDVDDRNLDDADDDGEIIIPLIPIALNALSYSDGHETDNEVLGICDDGPPPGGIDAPDAQNTMDEYCLQLGNCHVAFTQIDEYVIYKFAHTPQNEISLGDGRRSVFVDITVRVASASRSNIFRMEINDGNDGDPSEDFDSPGLGYHEFRNVIWRMVEIRADDPIHTLMIGFSNGNVNLCSIIIVPSEQTPPITWSALDFFDSSGRINVRPAPDNVCIHRDNSEKSIKAADYFEYEFYIDDGNHGSYDIWVRTTSPRGGRIRMELLYPDSSVTSTSSSSHAFHVPDDSIHKYHDIVYESLSLHENYYRLRVYFVSGDVKLCSVSVKPSINRYVVTVPGTYSALFYSNALELTSNNRSGNCPDGGRIADAQETTDAICQQAISPILNQNNNNNDDVVACNIGWTTAGETLTYRFETDGIREYVRMGFRISSYRPNRRLQVRYNESPSLLSNNNDNGTITFYAPGMGWQYYETLVWTSVQLKPNSNQHSIQVKFLDGGINICSFYIEYV